MDARDVRIAEMEAEDEAIQIVSDFLEEFYGGADRVPEELRQFLVEKGGQDG